MVHAAAAVPFRRPLGTCQVKSTGLRKNKSIQYLATRDTGLQFALMKYTKLSAVQGQLNELTEDKQTAE